MGKYLPMPYLSFSNAAEKFPEAAVLFTNELEATKKMEAQIKSILELMAQDAKRQGEEAKRQGEEAKRQGEEAKRQGEEYRKSIKLLEQLLNATK